MFNCQHSTIANFQGDFYIRLNSFSLGITLPSALNLTQEQVRYVAESLINCLKPT